MQDLRITLVQADQKWEDKSANFANYKQLLTGIEETDLIVLPEMFHTGFSMKAEELAESMNDSTGIEFLKGVAFENQAAVYTSLIIRDGSSYRNRGVFIQASGELEFYDKRKSFGLGGEDLVYSCGNESKIVEYRGWKINLQICYDLRFPEIVRNKLIGSLPAYDLVLYVANWPEKRKEHWKALTIARAIENQCYVAACNRVGEDGNGLVYSGDSSIVDPLGKVFLSQAGKECIVQMTLSKKYLKEVRESLPFLKDA